MKRPIPRRRWFAFAAAALLCLPPAVSTCSRPPDREAAKATKILCESVPPHFALELSWLKF
jgi:hypothetical protein